MDIKIRELKRESTRSPRLAYSTSHEGQANYIAMRCDEIALPNVHMDKEVRVFALTRRGDFENIIKESFQYVDKPFPPSPKKHRTYSKNQSVIGVILRKVKKIAEGLEIEETKTYVTDGSIARIKFHVFKREIPDTKNYKIFRTRYEMLEYLEKQEGLIV